MMKTYSIKKSIQIYFVSEYKGFSNTFKLLVMIEAKLPAWDANNQKRKRKGDKVKKKGRKKPGNSGT